MSMNRFFNLTRIGAFSLIILCAAVAFSQSRSERIDTPAFSNEASLRLVENLVKEGYSLLEEGDDEGAIRKFEEAGKIVRSTWRVEYNTACALARAGHRDQALETLELMVRNGFDYPGRLEQDLDLKSLRELPAFGKLVERAAQNYENGTASLVRGLPTYDPSAEGFDTEGELNEWVKQQDRLHYLHRNIWTAAELLAAQIDMQARYVSALCAFRAGDPDFDPGLERVRASIRLKSLARPGWGNVADLVRNEVDAYARTSPAAEALGEANFFAGMVLSLKYEHDDPRRVDAYDTASGYLEKVGEGHEYNPPARALMLVNGLLSPDANEAALGRKLAHVVEAYPGDRNVYTIISTRLNHDAARALWPIPLEAPDIDGNAVSLEDYRGSVVLIDFWAIICIPCRKEIPNLVDVYGKYHESGFEIISVCLDSKERTTLKDLRRFIDKNRMTWRHIFDGKAWESELLRRFFVGSVPASFLVGADGSLIAWGDGCRGENLALNVRKALSARGGPFQSH